MTISVTSVGVNPKRQSLGSGTKLNDQSMSNTTMPLDSFSKSESLQQKSNKSVVSFLGLKDVIEKCVAQEVEKRMAKIDQEIESKVQAVLQKIAKKAADDAAELALKAKAEAQALLKQKSKEAKQKLPALIAEYNGPGVDFERVFRLSDAIDDIEPDKEVIELVKPLVKSGNETMVSSLLGLIKRSDNPSKVLEDLYFEAIDGNPSNLGVSKSYLQAFDNNWEIDKMFVRIVREFGEQKHIDALANKPSYSTFHSRELIEQQGSQSAKQKLLEQ